MRTFLTPLLRSSIGFDHVDRLLDSLSAADEASLGYPPYNIEKSSEDDYRITMAVAGFASDEIDVTEQNHVLFVRGKAREDADGVTYLHRGIARRAFERRFELADTIKVVGARLENGLLTIDLKREIPEANRPRKVAIQRTEQAATKAAA
jgi:molecular chaperone IbpA